MNNSGIYKITNILNNHSYIGKTNNAHRRWNDHQRLAFTSGHKEYNKTLYQAMRKYGINNFTFEIIEYIPLEDYNMKSGEREKYWIDYYNTYYDGYNESKGGDGGSVKGHCTGINNGRALLNTQDIIDIRTIFQQGSSAGDCYLLYQDKISRSAFGHIWRGETYTDIMPEVYTESNIERNERLGYSKYSSENGKKCRKLTTEQIIEIRTRRHQKEAPSVVFLDYQDIIAWRTFQKIWYYQTYKEIGVFND